MTWVVEGLFATRLRYPWLPLFMHDHIGYGKAAEDLGYDLSVNDCHTMIKQ